MKKRYLIVLLLCCLMIIPLVGCSKKDTTGTTKVVPKTQIQILTDRVNVSDAINSAQDQTDIDLGNRITNEKTAPYNDAPVLARLVALEGLGMSTMNASLAFINVRLAAYDSYNISVRLNALESKINTSPTATPLPNGSTPTPTPTGNHNPTIISLIASPLTPSSNQSWIVTCAANDSDNDGLNYLWASTGGVLLYFSGNNSLLWSLPITGTYSIVCQVNDGKDGYDIEIKTVVW